MRTRPSFVILVVSLAALGCAKPAPDALQRRPLPEAPPMPAPARSGTVAVNGARLHYAVFHPGASTPPVVLLHGGLGDGELWAAEVQRLAPTHEVIVLDTRGHGRSTMPATPFSYALFASDVLGVLDSLRVPRAAIVGWSDGGITGLVLAMRAPQRIAGLLTYGAHFDSSGLLHVRRDSVRAARFRARAEAQYRRVSPTPDGFADLGRALGALYRVEPALAPSELRTIAVPTTIVAGEYEQFIAREHTETLARLIPGARLVILPGLDHGGPLQDPDRFHRTVLDFLARLAPAAP